MAGQTEVSHNEFESSGNLNGTMYKLTGVLGLTTGVGVIAWGLWSLAATLVTLVYEETGFSVEELLMNNAFNEGLLLSAVVIALRVIVLELKKIQDLMLDSANRRAHPNPDNPAALPGKSGTTT